MKKLIVFIIILIFLALWGFGVILPDAGYVLVILGQKTVETSLWFACFAILAIAVIWWLATRFVHVSWSIAQRLTDFFVFGTTERASKRAASGMIDFLSGDWLQARKKLLRTANKVESPLVNYLAAARASYELGDHEEAVKILHEAQKKYTTFSVPIGVAQAKMEMRDGRYEQAKIILLSLQQRAPKNPLVINSLRELYEVRNDWLALNDLVPLVKKFKVCSVADIFAMESSIVIGQIKLASESAERLAIGDRLHELRKAWGKVATYQQRIPRVVAAYAQALMHNLQDQEAEVILRKTLSKTWDDSLIDLYGVLRVVDVAEAISNAESWLKYYPQNPYLLRALGRLNLRNHLWGLARDYFQRSLVVQKNAETYAELARLLNSLGDSQKSTEVYQAALQLSVPSLPDLPQPSKSY
ncbi:heme biosynthesis protein HemY [Cellvibrio zantedeschiae]|uniref:Heme biosynthesis protein HemY n=1 Tax=Cellvibrio zantedeschiae TaxID=1237077 RepID=A0ABQ3B6F4_9GAMM|nr:heme biosynthesis HemY N-terminal domain-containing protein [Cellvibrio zantedeschiae]GGY82052.1 heme biosynthesis protein HemY [Cellvibrio zantedeschiae]